MWLLAGLMTAITLSVGIACYYFVALLDLIDTRGRMPPKARAELEYLVDTGQKGSDRYFELYDKYSGDTISTSDWAFIGLIAAVSTAIGGSVAFVVARRISRPITAVARAATLVAAGDRTARVDPTGASGETGELVDSFNRMAHDIESYERERTVLTAGIAHELRTPLTILKGRLHGLVDGVIEPSTGEADRLLRQVEQLSRLVEDLRTLAHADAGELELDLRTTEISQVARSAVGDLRPTTDSVVFELDCQPVMVSADVGRMLQVLINLLTNAVKHSPDQGVILVSVRPEAGWATIRVTDEGPGFREEDEQRLFTPFWRAGQNKAAGRPGSGMGLTLAAKLIEAQGGRIIAANRRDRSGAVFSVLLPIAQRNKKHHRNEKA